MKYIKGFFAFWYDFIVGDAWEVATGVVLALVVLYTLIHLGVTSTAGNAWSHYSALLLPIAIVTLLSYSLWRVRRS